MKTRAKPEKKAKGRLSGSVREQAREYNVGKSPAEGVLPYASFEVSNFRGFDTLKIDSFSRVNLVTGINNSGKTSLLEALFLLMGPTNPSLAWIIDGWRGLNIVSEAAGNQWTSLFRQFLLSEPIDIRGTNSKGLHRSLKITTGSVAGHPRQNIVFEYVDEEGKQFRVEGKPVFVKKDNAPAYELRMEPLFSPQGIVPGVFVSCHMGRNLEEEIQRFSDLRKKEKDGFVLAGLRIIEPRLERLEILTYQAVTMLHGYLKGYDEPVPSPLLGDGVGRSLSILLAMGAAEHGVVLVDEIENGIHHSAMKALWKVICQASKAFNCQVFATTHSEECIRAAHAAFKESESYDLSLYRLDRKNGSIGVVVYDEETLDTALSIPLEVRGRPVK
jgi:hypothetical protein